MPSTVQGNPPTQWVIRLGVIREAIRFFQRVQIHETMPAYLHLRHRAKGLGRFTDLQPEWRQEPAQWMDVPGGPPGKPYFRPFTSRGMSPNGFWLNDNLAGSYAKSSLRKQGAIYIDPQSDTFALPVDPAGNPDPAPILSQVFMGDVLPAWAFSAFLFRNHALNSTKPSVTVLSGATVGGDPTWDDLIEAFFDYFGFTERERSVLFSTGHPRMTTDYPVDEPCEEFDPNA